MLRVRHRQHVGVDVPQDLPAVGADAAGLVPAPAQQCGGGKPRGGSQIPLSAEDRRPAQSVPIGRLPDAPGKAGLPRNDQRLLLAHYLISPFRPRGADAKSNLFYHNMPPEINRN